MSERRGHVKAVKHLGTKTKRDRVYIGPRGAEAGRISSGEFGDGLVGET